MAEWLVYRVESLPIVGSKPVPAYVYRIVFPWQANMFQVWAAPKLYNSTNYPIVSIWLYSAEMFSLYTLRCMAIIYMNP